MEQVEINSTLNKRIADSVQVNLRKLKAAPVEEERIISEFIRVLIYMKGENNSTFDM